MKHSIVPEIIGSKKIVFFDEKDLTITLCDGDNTRFRYVFPFKEPFLIIDTFAKKTSRPEEIVGIDIDELKKLRFIITTIKAGRNKWFSGQRTIYRIESVSNISPGSKKLNYIPTNHSIQKDVVNNKVRLIGPNAGYPRRGRGDPWISFQ